MVEIDLSEIINWYKDVKIVYCTCNRHGDSEYTSTENASKTRSDYYVEWNYDNTTGILSINTSDYRTHYGYYVVVG